MVSRTSKREVTFRRPFRLSGFDARQPPGTYQVETVEELIEALSFAAWKRISTTMPLTYQGVTEYIPVDLSELDSALERDAEPEDLGKSDAPSRALGGNARRTL